MKTLNQIIDDLQSRQKKIKQWHPLVTVKVFKNKKVYNRKVKHKIM